MGKINKGFAFYFLLFFGILLGAFAVCVVIMIFVPDFSLFGLRAFNENYSDLIIEMNVYSDEEDTTSESLDIRDFEIDKIEVNSTVHSFNIFKSNSSQGTNFDQFSVTFSSKTFGFTTGDAAKSEISLKYYEDTKTLKIDAVGPQGFLNFGQACSISLQIPPSYSYSTNDIELVVDTNDKDIKVGDSYGLVGNEHPNTLELKSIDLKTTGKITVTEYANIGVTNTGICSIEGGNSEININTTINATEFSLKAGETTVKFKEEGNSFNVSGDINIETNNTFVYFGIVIGDNVYLKNTYGKMYFEDRITGDVIIEQESSKCDYEFVNIIGNFSVGSYIGEDLVDGGYILVSSYITGEAEIACNGEVNIAEVRSLTKIKGLSSAINISKVNVSTTAVEINTADGNISVGGQTDATMSRVALTATGNGSVVAYFESFEYSQDVNSSISTNNGNISVYLREDISRDISATTTKSLTYLGTEIESGEGEWIVAGTSVKELIITSTNGNIVIDNIQEE